MTDPRDQVAELREQASDLPTGSVQVALLEEAAQIADSLNDVELGYAVRNELMEAASFAGRSDIVLVAFSWCLAQYDRTPDRFNGHELLWKYKWVMGDAYKFPQISRARIEELFSDMQRRFRKAGSTMHAVQSERRYLSMQFGNRKAAQVAHAAYRKCKRDFLSDCPACVAYNDGDYYRILRQWGRTVQAVQSVLQGRLSCTHEPHCALSLVLRPLIHLGRVDEAKLFQRYGYRLVSGGAQFVRQHAEHLQFLVLTGEMAQAKRVLERHLPGALETVQRDNRFRFLVAARLWCARIAGQGKKLPKVRLPADVSVASPGGTPDVNALGEWFTAQAVEIARQFDSRNGSDWFQQQIDELPELLQLAED